MQTYYVEYCVWLEANSEADARRKAARVEAKIIEERSVTSATANSIEECEPTDEGALRTAVTKPEPPTPPRTNSRDFA